MFYKKRKRGEVKLNSRQSHLLKTIIVRMRGILDIGGKQSPLNMYKEQLLDEYEDLELQLGNKKTLELIEEYEFEHNVSLKRPSSLQRKKIKDNNGETSHNT